MSSQDNSKNSIRVLIDRYPLFDCEKSKDSLTGCQPLDVNAQKIKPLIDEFHYIPEFFPNEERVILKHASKPSLDFKVVRDETTRALVFMRGEADVLYDTLSLAKTEWVRHQKSNIQVYSAPGFTLSYLGFQNQHPILKDRRVREAIAHALPIDEWIRYKFFNWVDRPNEFDHLSFDLAKANALLDEAGYPLRDHERFSLRYFTTQVREGNETAQLVREALKQIGIDVQLTVVESSLFYEKIQKGDFELFSSRWYRFSNRAPLSEILGIGQKRNYVHYSNPALDSLDARKVIADEMPILPLYNWKHGLVAGPRILAPTDIESKLDETFRFLNSLALK